MGKEVRDEIRVAYRSHADMQVLLREIDDTEDENERLTTLLAQVAAERDAAQRRGAADAHWARHFHDKAKRLRAYAMALRGDLVEIDTALSEGDHDAAESVIGRHMRGTLDEDVAALASESQT